MEFGRSLEGSWEEFGEPLAGAGVSTEPPGSAGLSCPSQLGVPLKSLQSPGPALGFWGWQSPAWNVPGADTQLFPALEQSAPGV